MQVTSIAIEEAAISRGFAARSLARSLSRRLRLFQTDISYITIPKNKGKQNLNQG